MLTYSKMYPMMLKRIQALVSEQTCLSYAVPDIINGIRVDKYFLYSMASGLERGRPWGLVIVSMDSGEILVFQNCHISDFMKTEDYPFENPINYALPRQLPIKEFKAHQKLQGKLYEKIRKIAFKQRLTDDEQILLRKYLILLEGLIPASLVPYYQAMGSNFFEWGNHYV